MLVLGLAERCSDDKNTSLQQCDYQWSKKFYITSASESILFLCWAGCCNNDKHTSLKYLSARYCYLSFVSLLPPRVWI